MNWFEHIDAIIFANNYDHIFANRNKFRMRHGKLPAIGRMNDKWLEPVGDPIPNMLNIHKQTIQPDPCFFKPAFSTFESQAGH